MKRFYVYPAIFHPEEIGFSVFFPDLKGCQSQGETIEEATLMAQEALGAYLECLKEDDKPVPSPSPPKSLLLSSEDFVAMVSVDILRSKDKPAEKP